MTETAATTRTSVDSAEAKPADDSASPEEGTRAEATDNEAVSAASTEEQEEQAVGADAGVAARHNDESPGVAAAGAGAASPRWFHERLDRAEPAGSPRAGFIRPPGMVPPPEHPSEVGDPPPERTTAVPVAPAGAAATGPTVAVGGKPASPVPGATSGAGTPLGGSFPTLHAAAPVSAPPRVTGQTVSGGATPRPFEPDSAGGAAGTVGVSEPIRPRPASAPRGPRRARLNLKRVDPWSVMKFSFAVSLVLFIVVIVAASVLYLALDTMGVFTSINNTVAELIQSGAGEGGGEAFQITAQGVIGTAGVLGAVNVLLFTSLATLSAFIYNVCADLVGGVEVTLAERD